jgi:hypothetical protein
MRLAAAATLFIAWIGYLAYLVAITREPVILSRPQLLDANLYMVAKIDGTADKPNDKVHVLAVPWSKADAGLVGTEIIVVDLEKCTELNGWVGPGEYIVPITKTPAGNYRLAEIPLSPGFYHDSRTHNYLRIYHATPQAREQLTKLIADFHDGNP